MVDDTIRGVNYEDVEDSDVVDVSVPGFVVDRVRMDANVVGDEGKNFENVVDSDVVDDVDEIVPELVVDKVHLDLDANVVVVVDIAGMISGVHRFVEVDEDDLNMIVGDDVDDFVVVVAVGVDPLDVVDVEVVVIVVVIVVGGGEGGYG